MGPAAWLLILPIRFYQRFITPYTPATCRYYPTCSAYAVGALRTHGAIKGLLLGAWRLLRCNPWSSGGVDRVPPRGCWRNPPPAPDADTDIDFVASSDGEHDVAVVAGPGCDVPGDTTFGRAAAGHYVIADDAGSPEETVTSEQAARREPAVPLGLAVPHQMTNGDGRRAADDTARPREARAPSAGRTAA